MVFGCSFGGFSLRFGSLLTPVLELFGILFRCFLLSAKKGAPEVVSGGLFGPALPRQCTFYTRITGVP